jgi:hypothetical protein
MVSDYVQNLTRKIEDVQYENKMSRQEMNWLTKNYADIRDINGSARLATPALPRRSLASA